jgi:hypothetical protein
MNKNGRPDTYLPGLPLNPLIKSDLLPSFPLRMWHSICSFPY